MPPFLVFTSFYRKESGLSIVILGHIDFGVGNTFVVTSSTIYIFFFFFYYIVPFLTHIPRHHSFLLDSPVYLLLMVIN